MDQGHPWDIVKCRERSPSSVEPPQENVTKAYSAPAPRRALQAEGTVWTRPRRGAMWWEDGRRRFWRKRSRGDGVLEAQGGLGPRGSVSSLREERLEEMTISDAQPGARLRTAWRAPQPPLLGFTLSDSLFGVYHVNTPVMCRKLAAHPEALFSFFELGEFTLPGWGAGRSDG